MFPFAVFLSRRYNVLFMNRIRAQNDATKLESALLELMIKLNNFHSFENCRQTTLLEVGYLNKLQPGFHHVYVMMFCFFLHHTPSLCVDVPLFKMISNTFLW